MKLFDPEKRVLNKGVFDACGWKSALSSTDLTYAQLRHRLAVAAKHKMEALAADEAKMLGLMADVCWMRLDPDDVERPFKPAWVTDGVSAIVPEGIPDDVLDFFGEVVTSIDVPMLRARWCDVIWLRRRKEVALALEAVNAYTQVPVERAAWSGDGQRCWLRAVRLSRWLGASGLDWVKKIGEALVPALSEARAADGDFGRRIAMVMRALPVEGLDVASIAAVVAGIANDIASVDCLEAIDYYLEAAGWYELCGDALGRAKCWVAAADLNMSRASEFHLMKGGRNAEAESCAESAYRFLRKVPKSLRRQLDVIGKMKIARDGRRKYAVLAVKEMRMISVPLPDAADLALSAQAAVRGKSLDDALRGLASLRRPTDVDSLRSKTRQMLEANQLELAMPFKVLDDDGRTIAKLPGASFDAEDGRSLERMEWAKMVQLFCLDAQFSVLKELLPAVEVIRLEHNVLDQDVASLVRRCGLIPDDRLALVTKGLMYGFRGDWAAASHVLVFQVEHLVRLQLQHAGIATSTINDEGIEEESGISTLMRKEGVDTLLGPSMAFELRALLCDRLGPNMRNALAHGLVGDRFFGSAYAPFLWWMVVRLVVVAYGMRVDDNK